MMKNIKFLSLTLTLILFSCGREIIEDEEEYSSTDIIGKWSRTDEVPSGGLGEDYRYFDMVFTYTFNSDASYSNTIDFYGFKDENPDEIIGQSETIGTFEVKGDSIFIKLESNTSWENSFMPEPKTMQYEESEGYGSRYDIINKTLTLYYLSYPADAPVPIQMSYQKID